MLPSELKAQLKKLLAAKEYKAAIVLLEASDLPDKHIYIARIQLKMREEQKATEAAKPAPDKGKTYPAPEKAKPKSRGCLYVSLAVIVIVVLFIVYAVVQVQHIGDNVEDDLMWTGVGAYCSRILFDIGLISDCDAWEAWIQRDYSDVVLMCHERGSWLRSEYEFYDCLTDELP